MQRRKEAAKVKAPKMRLKQQDGACLELKHCFGRNKRLFQHWVAFSSQDVVVYLLHFHLVVHHIVAQTCQYFDLDPGIGEIEFFQSEPLLRKLARTNQEQSEHVIILGEEYHESSTVTPLYGLHSKKSKAGQSAYISRVLIRYYLLGEKETGPSQKFTLTLPMREPFKIKQVELRQAQNLCYILLEAQEKESLIMVWNFKRESLLLVYEPVGRLNKFVCLSNDKLLGVGPQLCRCYLLDFQNKQAREDEHKIIPMKVEKDNTFTDVVLRRRLALLVSLQNQIVLLQDLQMRSHLYNTFLPRKVCPTSSCPSRQTPGSATAPISEGVDDARLDSQDEQTPSQPQTAQLLDPTLSLLARSRRERVLSDEHRQPIKVMRVQEGGDNREEKEEEKLKEEILGRLRKERAHYTQALWTKKGFIIIAGAYVLLFEVEEKERGALPRCISVASLPKEYIGVLSAAKNKEDTTLAIASIYPLDLLESRGIFDYIQRVEILTTSLKALEQGNDSANWSRLARRGLHDAAILGLSIAKNKSVAATLGSDQSIRIWKFENEWKGTSCFDLGERALSLSIHPSGWQIAVGFTTGMRIYLLGEKEIELLFQQTGATTLCTEYSHGGEFLACGSATQITMLDTMMLRPICIYNGRTGVLRCLNWSQDDQYLVSTCHQGSLLLWEGRLNITHQAQELFPKKRYMISQFKECPQGEEGAYFEKASFDSSTEWVVALSNMGSIVVFAPLDQEPQVMFVFNLSSQGLPLSLIILEDNLLIGTSKGRVLIFSQKGYNQGLQIIGETQLERSAINQLCLTPCGKFLVAGSDEGNIYFLEVAQRVKGIVKPWHVKRTEFLQSVMQRRAHFGLTGHSLADALLLIPKARYWGLAKQVAHLEEQISDVTLQCDLKKRRVIRAQEQERDAAELTNEAEIARMAGVYEDLRQEHSQELARLELIKERQSSGQSEQLHRVDEQLRKEHQVMEERNDELQLKVKEVQTGFVKELKETEHQHRRNKEALVGDFQRNLRVLRQELQDNERRLHQNSDKYVRCLDEKEEDYERRVERLRRELGSQKGAAFERFSRLQEKVEAEEAKKKLLEEEEQMVLMRTKEVQQEVEDLAWATRRDGEAAQLLQAQLHQGKTYLQEKRKQLEALEGERDKAENLLHILGERMEELAQEREPLEARKEELIERVGTAFKEFNTELDFRKAMQMEAGASERKFHAVGREAQDLLRLQKALKGKEVLFKEEL